MDDKKIQLQIVTPEKTVCAEEIYQITLPVKDGIVTILPDHRSYIAALKPGEIVFKNHKNTSEETSLFVLGGFVEFHKNILKVLVDDAERAEEIDIAKAEAARDRAAELKKQVRVDEADFAHVAATLEKELARVKVARKYLHRRGF